MQDFGHYFTGTTRIIYGWIYGNILQCVVYASHAHMRLPFDATRAIRILRVRVRVTMPADKLSWLWKYKREILIRKHSGEYNNYAYTVSIMFGSHY